LDSGLDTPARSRRPFSANSATGRGSRCHVPAPRSPGHSSPARRGRRDSAISARSCTRKRAWTRGAAAAVTTTQAGCIK
jgi:hypothetical protein